MDIQVNIENAVSAFSYADKQVIRELFLQFDFSRGVRAKTINLKIFAEEIGFSRTMLVNCMKMLCSLGVISTQNRGPAGTYIYVCNVEACQQILALCS